MDIAHARELAFLSTIDAGRDMTRRATSGVVHDEGGIVLLAGPHWLPVLVNGVARLDQGVSPREVLDRARRFSSNTSGATACSPSVVATTT